MVQSSNGRQAPFGPEEYDGQLATLGLGVHQIAYLVGVQVDYFSFESLLRLAEKSSV